MDGVAVVLTKAVHVTDARERAIEVRVLVSTATPDPLVELRATA